MRSGSLLSLQGRIGVLTFNTRILLYVLMTLAIIAVALLAGGFPEGGGPFPPGALLIGGLGMLLSLPFYVCMLVQRLHDLDYVGWWALLMLVPLVSAVMVLYMALAPGKKVRNRYGDWRAPTSGERLWGVIGMGVAVLLPVLVVYVALSGPAVPG